MTDQPAALTLRACADMPGLREVSDLLVAVWGRNEEGAPMPSEVLRSLVHADGLVSTAHDADGHLVGAAVLGRAAPGECYGYIAAARPGAADRGIGFALKQHQRSWALAHDVTTMRWTFDPLVSRNARFNLTKLGAVVHDYEPAFYGRMSDGINGDDVADRLVACWRLDSPRAVACATGSGPERAEPDPDPADPAAEPGPDGAAAWLAEEGRRWCRVPTDIVALRRSDPAQASAWRRLVGERLQAAFADGWQAVAATRAGWYRLEPRRPDPTITDPEEDPQ